MNAKLRVIIMGIQIKLNRGKVLEDILTLYVNLTDEEKEVIRNYFNIDGE